MNYWIVDKNEKLRSCSRVEIGGKGWGLVQLVKQGLRVPPFGIINTEGVRQRIWNTDANFRSVVEAWCKEVLDTSKSKKLAVRSSACEEDQRHRSFAGKFLTEVISNIEELIPILDKVVAHYEEAVEKERNKIYTGPRGLAIIVQDFISGKMSGVCFSVEPVNANPERAYCEIVIGENKSLVEGEIRPTCVSFSSATTEVVEIREGTHGPEQLPYRLLEELSNGLLKMEWGYRTAVDMEWTWDGENIWFLQVRPITIATLSQELYPKECATCWFFDQRFIEPITPITQTTLIPLILRKAISEGLSMRHKSIAVEPYYFGGQVYLPHRVYFDLLEGCPKWWLSSDLKLLFPEDCGCPPRKMKIWGIQFWLDAFRSLLKHWQDAIFVLCRWERWRKQLEEELNHWDEKILTKITAEEWLKQWEKWNRLSEEFLEIHRWAILWSSYVYRLVGKYVMQGKENQYPSITTQANHILHTYLSTYDTNAWVLLCREYAHRTESLDFMSPRWDEWLSGEEQNSLFEMQIVDDKKSITIETGKVGYLYRIISKFIHLREEQRFEWEKILYIQKKLLKEAGKRLVEKGILNEIHQVWFLTWQELREGFIKNKPINIKKVSARQHQWCVEHVFTKPSFINHEEGNHYFSKVSDTWSGWGVSGGKIKGIAYVTNNPTQIPIEVPHPRILVTTCLNPGQTWCLQYWDGVLLERGSELSHPAIIAREMNIPMITNLLDITHKLTTGDSIYMDATYGKVERVGQVSDESDRSDLSDL